MSPFAVRADPAHGGRITSLRDPSGHEWLWSHPVTATRERRRQVRPGDGFVDAGGVEECCPTISGRPDHGDVWSRAWSGSAAELTVQADGFRLRRRTSCAETLTLDYELTAEPGFRFVWALHALLRPEPGTSVEVAATRSLTWTAAGDLREGRWPCDADGEDLRRLGPDDGSAQFVLLPDVSQTLLRQGSGELNLTLEAPGQPVALGLWRNLGGYSGDGGPAYRSFGVEPMLGDHPDLQQARRCGVVPESGTARWRVRIGAARVPDLTSGFRTARTFV